MHTRQLRPLHLALCAASTLLMTLPLDSTLLAQSPPPQTAAQRAAQSQRRLLAPNIELVAPKLPAARHQQLKTTKRRADLNALRAATSRDARGAILFKLPNNRHVQLVPLRSIQATRVVRPATMPPMLERYKDYVDGKPGAQAPPASHSLKSSQSPVRDQQGRGTCVAFAAVAAIEAAYHRSGRPVDLSEEDAFFQLTQSFNEHPCHDGAYSHAALDVLSRAPISLEADWPYTPTYAAMGCPADYSDASRRPRITRPARAAQNAQWGPAPNPSVLVYRAQENLAQDAGPWANNPRQIEAWLAAGHEVLIGAGVAANLSARGVIDVELDEDGAPMGAWAGHAMLIVGYNRANGGTFEVKNSWGTGAGLGGYITLSYDYIRTYNHTVAIMPHMRVSSTRSPQEVQQVPPTPTPSAQPRANTPPTAPHQAAPSAPQPIATLPPGGLNQAQLARVRQLGDQLRQLDATKAEAAHLNQCAIIEQRREGGHTYHRTIPLWQVSLVADLAKDNSANSFDCRAGQSCITYAPVQSAPRKDARPWVHASLRLCCTPADNAQKRAQAVNLWRQLIAACTPQGDRA